MKRKLALLLLGSSAMIVPAAAQQAGQNPNQAAGKALLQAADKAIGASNVRSVAVTATGWIGSPGQQFSQGDLPRADLKSYTLIRDYNGKSAKTDYVRVQGNNPPRGGGGIPVQGEARTAEFVNGNSAWNLNAQGQPNPQPQAAADRQHMMLTDPVGFIKAGMEAQNAAATDRYFARQNRTVKVVGFTTKVCDGPQPACTRRLTGEFNNDNLLERVITWVPDPVLGDKMVEFRYGDYRDVGGGVKLPFRLHAHMGDHPLIPGGHNWMDLRASDIKVNIPDAAQAVPDNVRTAQPAQVEVVKTELAPGVVLMGGGTHNSVAVEFKDFVTVIEGPLNQQRSLAVIAEVKRTFPNKPIRYLVNTHNHFDHLGGVRTFVAEGATVITDDGNRDFYRRVVLAPQSRTLQPDRLSQRPFAPTGPGTRELQTFTDKYTISDGNQIIELYHVDGLNHSDNMLIAYLPKQRIVVNADLYGPPPAGGNLQNVSANAVALFRNIKRLNLDVATHVPIHGTPGSQADFERIVGPVAARVPGEQPQLIQVAEQLKMALAGEPIVLSPQETIVSVTLTSSADAMFPSGDWRLPINAVLLDKMLPTLSKLQATKIIVRGYTDNTPIGQSLQAAGVTDNLDLSARRAMSVVRYLVSHGVNPNLLSAQSFGATDPVAPNNTPDGRAKNRRVEIMLIGGGS